TFEEILAKSQPPPEGAPASRPPPERKSRPPRQKEERKMPVVVRKPALGATPPAEAPLAEAAASGEQPAAAEQPRPAEVPESVYAQPGADENADFAALFAESGAQQKQGKLRAGQKVSARIAHLGGEVAFLDLGGKGEGIIDLRELRNDKGDLLAHAG